MSPRLGTRTYGAVDDPPKAVWAVNGDDTREEGVSGDDRQASASLRTPMITEKAHRKRGWVALAIACGLAAAAATAFVRVDIRSPARVQETMSEAPGSDGYSNLAAATTGEHVGVAQYMNGQHEALVTLTDGDSKPLEFTALNFYHIRDGKPGNDYPWLKNVKLIEPHRETTLTVTNPTDGHEYRWSVSGEEDAAEIKGSGSGAQVAALFYRLDENTIRLEEVDADGVVTRSLEEVVMVKYVRREIRTLTDEERIELLDSMVKLWEVRVQGGNGKELYGDDYSDIWAINRLHFKAASPPLCDHFHDGLGFLTSHSLLTNTFEFSLQQVNPKLTVPYWDFTIESSTTGGAHPEHLESQDLSPMFDSSWFGSHDPTDMQVKDGRWAYTEIPRMKLNNPGNINADVYSKLRAPWTLNDRPYLTRSMGDMCGFRVQEEYPWPTCQMHYKLVTEYTDFYSWLWYSLYDPHGPVHVWLGGVLDCEATYEKIKNLLGDGRARDLAMLAFVHRKNLYRDGIFKCEGSADISTKPSELLSEGTCGCLDYDLTQGDDYTLVMGKMALLPQLLDGFSEEVKREVVQNLCAGITNDGDHLQASSSLDPTFWPTHPTMERVWMYTLLSGKMTDFTWPGDDHSVRDERGATERISIYTDHCVGHRAKDVFPFGLLNDDDDFKVSTGIKGNPSRGNVLTNIEVLHSLDPRENKVSYIYDNFQWSHCEVDGYAFSSAIERDDESAAMGSRGVKLRSELQSGHAAVKLANRATPHEEGGQKEMRPVLKEGGSRYHMYSALERMEKRLAEQEY